MEEFLNERIGQEITVKEMRKKPHIFKLSNFIIDENFLELNGENKNKDKTIIVLHININNAKITNRYARICFKENMCNNQKDIILS